MGRAEDTCPVNTVALPSRNGPARGRKDGHPALPLGPRPRQTSLMAGSTLSPGAAAWPQGPSREGLSQSRGQEEDRNPGARHRGHPSRRRASSTSRGRAPSPRVPCEDSRRLVRVTDSDRQHLRYLRSPRRAALVSEPRDKSERLQRLSRRFPETQVWKRGTERAGKGRAAYLGGPTAGRNAR